MRRILPWPRQLPDTASLAEFQKAYAFLKAVPFPGLSSEQERQRLMFGYSMFVLTRSALFAFVISSAAVLACLVLPHFTDFNSRAVSFLTLWPPNALLRSKMLGHAALDPASQNLAVNAAQVLWSTSVAHLTWIAWLLWRIFTEQRRTEYAVDRDTRVYVYLVVSAAGWIFLLSVPTSDQSSFAPAFQDEPVVFAIKEAMAISLTYFVTGGAIMYATTELRNLRRRKRVVDNE